MNYKALIIEYLKEQSGIDKIQNTYEWNNSCGDEVCVVLNDHFQRVTIVIVDRAGIKEGWEKHSLNYTNYGYKKLKKIL
jgi:hypothetical protein